MHPSRSEANRGSLGVELGGLPDVAGGLRAQNERRPTHIAFDKGVRHVNVFERARGIFRRTPRGVRWLAVAGVALLGLAACNSSEPTRLRRISYAVFCLKKKKPKRTRESDERT